MSVLVWSSQYCYLKEGHGLFSLGQDSVLDEHMRSAMVHSYERERRASEFNGHDGAVKQRVAKPKMQ